VIVTRAKVWLSIADTLSRAKVVIVDEAQAEEGRL